MKAKRKKITIIICSIIIIIAVGVGVAQAVFPTGGVMVGILRDLLNQSQPDHFEISAINSPQTAGQAFPVTITAKDQNNQKLASFNGTVSATHLANNFNSTNLYFTATNTTVSPNFINGSWSGNIVLKTAVNDSWLKVISTSGKIGESNHFNIIPGAMAQLNVTCTAATIYPGQTSICTANGFSDGWNTISDPTILARTTWSFQSGANCGTLSESVGISTTFIAGTPQTSCPTTIVANNGNATGSFGIIVKINPPLFPIKVDYNPEVINNPPPGFTTPSSGTVSEKAP